MVKAAEVGTIAQEEGGALPIKAAVETDDTERTQGEDPEVKAKTKTTSMSYSSTKNKRRRSSLRS